MNINIQGSYSRQDIDAMKNSIAHDIGEIIMDRAKSTSKFETVNQVMDCSDSYGMLLRGKFGILKILDSIPTTD